MVTKIELITEIKKLNANKITKKKAQYAHIKYGKSVSFTKLLAQFSSVMLAIDSVLMIDTLSEETIAIFENNLDLMFPDKNEKKQAKQKKLFNPCVIKKQENWTEAQIGENMKGW